MSRSALTTIVHFTLLAITASQAAEPTAVSYDEHVKPIFRNHCLGCHNGEAKKGDLSLDTYAGTMEGGASGEVVFAGELDGSRLWALVNHDDTPTMPPDADQIPAGDLTIIRRWIEDGAAERPGSAKAKLKKKALQFQPAAADDGTPGAMPESICRQPPTTTSRAAAVTALAASPRAPLLAIGGQHQVTWYHADTCQLLGVIPFPEGTPNILRFSRDGSLLLAAGGRAAHSGLAALYDVRSGERMTRLGDEFDSILAADIDAPLSQLAIGGTSKVVKLLSVATGATLFTIKKHTDWVTAVEFSPDGKWLATADRAGGLVIWEAATAREYQVLDGHASAITALSWRDDSQLVASASEDGNIRLWDPEKAKASRSWAHGAGGVTDVRFARDGSLVTSGRNRVVTKWDASGKAQQSFSPMEDIALSVCITSDSKRVVGGDWAGNVLAWDTGSTTSVASLRANPPTINERLAAEHSQTKPLEDRLVEVDKQLELAGQAADLAKDSWQQSVAASATVQGQADQFAAAMKSLFDELLDLPANADEGQTNSKIEELVVKLDAMKLELAKLVEHTTAESTKLFESRRAVAASQEAQRLAAHQLTAHRQHITDLESELTAFVALPLELEKTAQAANERVSQLQTDLELARQQLAATENQSAQPAAEKRDVEPASAADSQVWLQKTTTIQSELEAAELAAAEAASRLQWHRSAYSRP